MKKTILATALALSLVNGFHDISVQIPTKKGLQPNLTSNEFKTFMMDVNKLTRNYSSGVCAKFTTALLDNLHERNEKAFPQLDLREGGIVKGRAGRQTYPITTSSNEILYAKNYKTVFSQLKSRQINHFKMNFSSKKDSPSIEIPKTSLKFDSKGIFIYKTYIPDKIKIGKKQQKMKLNIDYDCRLQFKNNKWFLMIPIKTNVSIIKNRKEYCSLDPGIRSFQTVYSEDSVLQIKIKKEMIYSLQKKIDNFKSLRDRKIIKQKRFKRTERSIYFRLNNLIDDLHHKTIDFLTKTFKYIILPSFESQGIAKKNKIKCVNRDLLQLKHYLFQQRLKAKCDLRNCTLDICTEEYTSKTCGRCGSLNNVGSNDVFNCTKCNLIIDRDVNGARNIAIKRLKEMGG